LRPQSGSVATGRNTDGGPHDEQQPEDQAQPSGGHPHENRKSAHRQVTTLAGGTGGYADGTSATAQFNGPAAVTFGPDGEPTATAFLLADLPPIAEIFSTGFDRLMIPIPGRPDYRAAIRHPKV
jgi:hypothetical protein